MVIKVGIASEILFTTNIHKWTDVIANYRDIYEAKGLGCSAESNTGEKVGV